MPWRRAWQPTPVLVPGEPHGQGSLANYSPWGHKESDTTERLTLALSAHLEGCVPGLPGTPVSMPSSTHAAPAHGAAALSACGSRRSKEAADTSRDRRLLDVNRVCPGPSAGGGRGGWPLVGGMGRSCPRRAGGSASRRRRARPRQEGAWGMEGPEDPLSRLFFTVRPCECGWFSSISGLTDWKPLTKPPTKL